MRSFEALRMRQATAPVVEAYRNAILALSPAWYSRLDDNAANSTVTDISTGAAVGGLLAITSGSGTRPAKNTSLVSSSGLLTTSSNLSFDVAGASVVTSPFKSLVTATGWTVVFLAMPTGQPVAGTGGVSCLAQLGDSGGSPELGLEHVSGTTFRLRVMRSGVALVANTGANVWNYGDKLWIVLRQLPAGNIELWVNNVRYINVAPTGISQVNKVFWWGSGLYGGATTYYQLVGKLDELSVFQTSISDPQKDALWALT